MITHLFGRPVHPTTFAILIACLTAGLPLHASPASSPRAICDRAARVAAQNSNVPLDVLQAITRTETGRRQNGRVEPWPWTVNMEGKGMWFDTLDEARAYVFRHFKRGARSFDIGCFQINYKWHNHAFSSIDEMFDPIANATYAAEFLSKLYREFGNWSDAAGAYHSRTPQYANRYKAVFERHRRDSQDQTRLAMANPPTPPAPRVNGFPLLQAGGSTRLGSLVPITNRSGVQAILPLARLDKG